jgi:hypothetical protein
MPAQKELKTMQAQTFSKAGIDLAPKWLCRKYTRFYLGCKGF